MNIEDMTDEEITEFVIKRKKQKEEKVHGTAKDDLFKVEPDDFVSEVVDFKWIEFEDLGFLSNDIDVLITASDLDKVAEIIKSGVDEVVQQMKEKPAIKKEEDIYYYTPNYNNRMAVLSNQDGFYLALHHNVRQTLEKIGTFPKLPEIDS